MDVDLNKGQDGAERPFRPFRKFYVFKSAVDAFDQVDLPLTPVIEELGLPFEALSRSAVQQFFMNTPSLRAVRLFGDENSVVAYSAISPLLQRSQLVTLDFGQCILSPGDMRLFASDLRQTRGLKDLTVRPKVQAFDQLEYMRALNDLGQALGKNTKKPLI